MGWSYKELSQICEILDKRRKPITKKNRVPGPYPYFGASGVLDYVDDFIFDEELVLLGEDGAKWGAGENSAFSISGKTWVNNHAHVLRPDRDKILDSWLIYYLNASDLSPFISGMTVPKLNQGRLREIEIPIPPIREQKRIVAILDEAFADIDKARALTELNLENARELFESYLQNALEGKGKSWLKKTLGDVCVLQRGFDLPKKNRVAGDFPLISSSGILERIDIAKVKGPGVVTGRSGSIGNVYYIDEDFWPLNTTLYVKEFYGNDEEFICWLLRHFDLTRFVSGAGVPTLNRNFVHGEFVRIPPEVNEQKKVAKRLETLQNELRGVYKIYEQKLSYLQELKKSLLQKAFTGELTKAA